MKTFCSHGYTIQLSATALFEELNMKTLSRQQAHARDTPKGRVEHGKCIAPCLASMSVGGMFMYFCRIVVAGG
jgi:hypothetical protein